MRIGPVLFRTANATVTRCHCGPEVCLTGTGTGSRLREGAGAARNRMWQPALTALLTILLSFSPYTAGSAQAASQQEVQPREYQEALEKLAAGDTATAIELLRVVTQAEPRFGPAFLQLGAVLTAQAGEVERDFADRLEAERMLRRALTLMGPKPEIILEWGMLMRKQHIRIDALRTVETAVRLAAEQEEDISPDQLARMHYGMGRIYEVWWEEIQDRCIPSRAEQACWFAAAPYAAACADVPDVHGYIAHRGRMLEHYRKALWLDPGNVDAGIRLLGHLAQQGDWEEYAALARQLKLAAPFDSRAFLFQGLGLHHRGRSDLAESAFQQALSLMSDDDLAGYRDISALLHPDSRRAYLERDDAGREDVERIFFIATDPMYLTDVEERRVAHYARVTWADLTYSSPASGARGWDTDRGHIHLRYGHPDLAIQIFADDDIESCGWPRWLTGSPRFRRDALSAVYWYYDFLGGESSVERPADFVFRRHPMYRYAGFAENTLLYSQDLQATRPERYQPITITESGGYAHQVVRFRSDDPELVRFEFHGAPPLKFLGTGAGDRLTAGLFLHDSVFNPVWRDRRDLELPSAGVTLSYQANLPPGAYFYSLEARATAPDSVPRLLARARQRIAGEAYAPDQVSLSDILLADSIEPRVPAVTRRADLHILPSLTSVMPPARPLDIYFEIYGLTPDEDGYGRFRAELEIAGAVGPSIVTRLLRGARDLIRVGPEEGPSQSWERIVAIPPEDDRIPEYLTVDLPQLRTGDYRIEIRVIDLESQDSATTTRLFTVDSRPSPPPRAQEPGDVGLEVLLPDPMDTRSLLHWLITGERDLPPDTVPPPEPRASPGAGAGAADAADAAAGPDIAPLPEPRDLPGAGAGAGHLY